MAEYNGKHYHDMTFGEIRTEAYTLKNQAMELEKTDPQRREMLKQVKEMQAHANAGCCGN